MGVRRGWILWGAVAVGLTAYLSIVLRSEDQTLFLPGQTTAGHYQIELNCTACHGTLADGSLGEVKQTACLECHAAELARASDAHPIDKFAKPIDAVKLQPLQRDFNAKLVKSQYCIICHEEHNPSLTRPMGLTQPEDYCQACHADVGVERTTHQGLAFATCLTAGCHNFHDNTALFEDFLAEHRHDEPMLPRDRAVLPARDFASRHRESAAKPVIALTRAAMDAPADVRADEKVLHDWETTAHARAGINCMDCHAGPGSGSSPGDWITRPGVESCRTCHESEAHDFLASRHGMRIGAGLAPLQPSMARLPMKASAASLEMNCNACHGAHAYSTTFAQVDACLQCHDDTHSRNYPQSSHARAWQDELAGREPPGTGVSCATCHLPRVRESEAGQQWVSVKHNQSDYLRPNEKMIRAACLNCHGLPLAIDALADRRLIEANFDAAPSSPHFSPSSFQMISEKLERLQQRTNTN